MLHTLWHRFLSIPWHRLHRTLLCLALSFMAGWWYHDLSGVNNPLYRANEALISYAQEAWIDNSTKNFVPINDVPTGVLYASDNQQQGFLLFSLMHDFTAKLIDKKGRLVHKWSIQPNDLPATCQNCSTPSYFRFTRLHANGDLLAILVNNTTTPWGGPLIKLNKKSQIQWVFDAHCHHDFTEDEKGNLYVLTHRFQQKDPDPNDPLNNLSPYYAQGLPYLEDEVTLLDPNGQRVASFSLIKALKDSPFTSLIAHLDQRGRRLHNKTTYFDPLHTNSIQYITTELAQSQPWLHPGDLLINAKHLNTLFVVNPKTQTITHAITGPWHYPHQVRIEPTGQLTLFDNLGHWPTSRLLAIDPNTQTIQWQFSYDPKHPKIAPLASLDRSGQQRIGNDHYLITESRGGRLLEIDQHHRIIWAYRDPDEVRIQGNTYHPFISRAYFFTQDQLPFLKS